jgi:hypothetical protein
MALSIKNLHHPLRGTQTKTSVTFGCAYLIVDERLEIQYGSLDQNIPRIL